MTARPTCIKNELILKIKRGCMSKIKDFILNLIKLKKMEIGYCPICEHKTIFYARNGWLRDHYFCVFCKSIPRQRAIIKYITLYFEKYDNMVVHESSPFGAASDFLIKNCEHYSSSHYFPEIQPGQIKDGFRCENLEKLTFDDDTFDIFVTQDVFEHIMNPDRAFKEISRVLKPGGSHIFTVPYYPDQKGAPRAMEKDGEIIYLKEQIYHGNPVSSEGSLVTYDWGYDFIDYIYEKTKMTTTILNDCDLKRGIEGEFIEVFISRKD